MHAVLIDRDLDVFQLVDALCQKIAQSVLGNGSREFQILGRKEVDAMIEKKLLRREAHAAPGKLHTIHAQFTDANPLRIGGQHVDLTQEKQYAGRALKRHLGALSAAFFKHRLCRRARPCGQQSLAKNEEKSQHACKNNQKLAQNITSRKR